MKKERLSKTSYYDDPLKLKEVYVKFCKSLSSFGAALFDLREIVLVCNDSTSLSSIKN